MASFWIGISTVLMRFLVQLLKILMAPGNNMPFLRCSELNTDQDEGIGFQSKYSDRSAYGGNGLCNQKMSSGMANPERSLFQLYTAYKCRKCAVTFTSERALIKHRLSCNPRMIFCGFCSKDFSSTSGLRAHIKNIHETPNIRSIQHDHNMKRCLLYTSPSPRD